MLSWASMSNSDRAGEVVELLLSYQSPVNVQCDHGRSALHHAVRRAMVDPQHVRVVRLLLDSGADVHAQDNARAPPVPSQLAPGG